MPLTSMLVEMKKAQAGGYAVPCFDTFDMLSTQGVIEALQEKRAPGIIGLYTGMFERPFYHAFADLVRSMGSEATVPVSIVLDHGASLTHCIRAIHAGFTDVMFDGSKLPLEENIAITRAVVQAAHAVGVGVEAELGHVGVGSNYQEFGAQGKGFTNPDEVEKFVAETGVDCLAVAIGTAHGEFQGEPHLALDLLAEIRRRVDIPLVLHGGSGLADEQFQAAICGGIAKINIFTSMALEAGRRVTQAAHGEKPSLFVYTNQIREGFKTEAMRHLDVFGTSGRAN